MKFTTKYLLLILLAYACENKPLTRKDLYGVYLCHNKYGIDSLILDSSNGFNGFDSSYRYVHNYILENGVRNSDMGNWSIDKTEIQLENFNNNLPFGGHDRGFCSGMIEGKYPNIKIVISYDQDIYFEKINTSP